MASKSQFWLDVEYRNHRKRELAKMNWISRLWFKWKCRDIAWDEMVLQHYLLIKSARRCAYDLCHAVDEMSPDAPHRLMFADRCQHWVDVFSLNGVKDYRIELVAANERLREENKRLEERDQYTDILSDENERLRERLKQYEPDFR